MAGTFRPKQTHVCAQCGWTGRRARVRKCPKCGFWHPKPRDGMDEFGRQQQAYARGEAAYAAGTPRDANPEADGLLRDAWFDGWDRARELDSE